MVGGVSVICAVVNYPTVLSCRTRVSPRVGVCRLGGGKDEMMQLIARRMRGAHCPHQLTLEACNRRQASYSYSLTMGWAPPSPTRGHTVCRLLQLAGYFIDRHAH